MSEVENTTANIDNNVQKTPKATPSKRLTNAERARIESELLVKALGGSLEGGRRTRSSARGSISPSPKMVEPVKRKAPATPRRPKKSKVHVVDETDAGNPDEKNHLSQNAPDTNAQAHEEKATKSVEEQTTKATEATEATITEPVAIQNEQKMDVDSVEVTQKPEESLPSSQQPIDETITIDGDSLNASPEASNEPTSPSVAATTTVVVVLDDVESAASEPKANNDSPMDDVTIIISSPPDSVSPPNEPSQSTPDAEPISIFEVNDDNNAINETKEKATTEAQTQIVDLSAAENDLEIVIGNNNTDHSNDVEIVQDVVGSTNNATVSECVETDKKSDGSVAVNNSMEETITTTSETIVEPPATAV